MACNFTYLEENDVPGAKLTKEPTACTVVELQRWLECHGQKKTGRKADLVIRVKGLMSLNIPVDPKVDGGKWYKLKDHLTTNSTNMNDEKGVDMGQIKWGTFPSKNIPSVFNEGHIYRYLIEEVDEMKLPGDDDDVSGTATAKHKTKGDCLFLSGFVENVEDGEGERFYHVRGHVHHSMKSDVPLQATVTFSKLSGYIKYGTCTCVAQALGRCCHIAALLRYVMDFVDKNGYIVNQPSTSRPCQWNLGKKRNKDPKALHKVSYQGSKRKSPDRLYTWDPRPINKRELNIPLMNQFISNLETISSQSDPSMWETLLQRKYSEFSITEEEKQTLLLQVQSFEHHITANVNHICVVQGVLDSIILSVESGVLSNLDTCCAQVPGTSKQSENVEWFNARWPIITASDCKVVFNIGKSITESKVSLSQLSNYLKKKMWNQNDIRTFDMIYGIKEEPIARKKYELETGLDVMECGLFVNEKYPWLGASPDGLVYEIGKAVGIIEIKCLKCLRNRTVSKLIEEVDQKTYDLKSSCFQISDNVLSLKKNHSYYFQIQLQLLITNLSFCDFVLHSNIGTPNIQRIYPDKELQKCILDYTYAFWKKAFIAEYFLMKVIRDLDPYLL